VCGFAVIYKMIYFIYKTDTTNIQKNLELYPICISNSIALDKKIDETFKISEIVKRKFLIKDLTKPSKKELDTLRCVYYYIK
jgi:hypothetical protein